MGDDSRVFTLDELIEELARVIWEPDRARTVVLSAGFPPQDLPDFKTPRVFWTLVMGGLHDGPGAGSVQWLSEKAALEFPDNEVFAGCSEEPPSSRGAARDAARLRREIIDFSSERNRHKHFFGREDVLAEMDAWVRERDGGWLVITGSPGLGKSALMDRWLRQREAAGPLTAFHFIRRGHLDWAEPQVVQRNLAAQIEVMVPEQRDPDADPVYRLEQLLGRVGPVLAQRGERLVLLVDGLDEAMTLGKDNPIPYIFPLEVPEGVFVVTASRPRYPHLNWFHRRTGATTWIDLDERVESNEQAVLEHWQRLGATMEPPLREELVHAAIGGARGNLLHAVKLFELWSRPNAKRSPGDVPQGFEGMLEELWERTGALSKDAKERVRDGLSLISAARESLPLRVVDELLGWNEGEAEDELLPLAREMLLEEPWHEEPAYRPFHEGLRELVERKRPRSIREHHGVLSAYAAWPIEDDAFRRSYALRHRVEHRVEAGELDDAAKACMDLGFLTAKACAEGVLAVERDIRLAAEARKDGETRERLTTLGQLVAASSHWASDVPQALPALLHDRALTNTPEILGALAGLGQQRSEHPRLRHPLQVYGMSRILQGHTDRVYALAVLPDGRLISGSYDGTLRVWDVRTGRTIAVLQNHRGWAREIAALTGDVIVTNLDDKNDSMIRVWNAHTGQSVVTLRGHTKMVSDWTTLTDGRVVSGSFDKTLRVWDVRTGSVVATLKGHTNRVRALAALPDGRIASGSDDKTIRVWDVGRETTLATLYGHENWVRALAVLPDGRIASASDDKTIRVWTTESDQAAFSLHGHTNRVRALAVLPDGRIASASDDKTIRVWDIPTSRTPFTHPSPVRALAVLPEGRVVSGSDDRSVRIWDAKTGRVVTVLQGHKSSVRALAVLPDGRVVSGSDDEFIRVWDVQAEQTVATFQGHQACVVALAVSPSGHHLFAGLSDDSIRAWDVRTGQTLVIRRRGSHMIRTLSIWLSHCVLFGSTHESARPWNMEHMQKIVRHHGRLEPTIAMALLPDGRAVSGSSDKTLRVWDVATGRTLATVYGDAGFTSVACVDQHLLAAGDAAGNVWFIDLPELPPA